MRFTLALLAGFLISPWVQAEDWPGWRGPRGDGHSSEKNLPLTWSAKDNIAWKTPIPGIGHSSPIIVGDRVFVTTCLLKEQQRVLYCLERASGKILWERVVLVAPLEPKNGLNSYSSSTPACDGQRVFVSFLRVRAKTADDVFPKFTDATWSSKGLVGDMVVACYDLEGQKLWEKMPGRFYARHGFCSPPILYRDKVIINGDQDANGFVVALDRATGEERWRIQRPNRTRSYCAPLIVQAAGKTQMVMTGSMCVAGYDPDNGREIWRLDGPTEQFVASPVLGEGLFFITTGYPEYHNMAIRPDGEGNITKTHVQWHEKKVSNRKASYVPSPLAYKNWFFLVTDTGDWHCFEARTGKRLVMEQLGNHHSASPIYAAGHFYVPDDDGVTHVLKAGPEFEVVARNSLGDQCFASPAVSGGQLFLRTVGAVWCIGKK